MHPIVSARKEEIREICRQHGVSRLDVFGSAARGSDFDPEHSDVDFLIEFDPGPDGAITFRRYLAVRDALAKVMQRPVDLTTADSIENPYLFQEIERSKEPVHAA